MLYLMRVIDFQQANFIVQRGLGGAMFWTVDFDDFGDNACGQGRYPLIGAVQQILGAAAPAITSTTPSGKTAARRVDALSSVLQTNSC